MYVVEDHTTALELTFLSQAPTLLIKIKRFILKFN